jgi:hypothetical protein
MRDALVRLLTPEKKTDTRARFPRWKCSACSVVVRARVPAKWCKACGAIGSYQAFEPVVTGLRFDEIQICDDGVHVEDWAVAMPNGYPLGRTIVLRGRPGAGKSRIGDRLASALGKTMAFGLEMGIELTADSARLCGAEVSRMTFYDDIARLDELEALDPDVVLVDSVQKLGAARARILTQLEKWVRSGPRRAVVLVSQQNQRGVSRYSESSDFDADIVCDVRKIQDVGSACHNGETTATPCAKGCAHVHMAKGRSMALIDFDVRVVK